jgi:hypothetical protein
MLIPVLIEVARHTHQVHRMYNPNANLPEQRYIYTLWLIYEDHI